MNRFVRSGLLWSTVPLLWNCAPAENRTPPLREVTTVARLAGVQAGTDLGALGALGGRLLTETGVRLLGAESHLLLDLDLEGRRVEALVATALRGLAAETKLGGLAAAAGGGWWTVRDRTTLALIEETGSLGGDEAVPFDAFAVYGWNGDLLAQVARAESGQTVFRRRVRAGEWIDVGNMKARERATTTETLLWNMAHCGASQADVLPCWFLVDKPEVALVGGDGSWSRCPMRIPAGTGSEVRLDGSTTIVLNFRDLFVSSGREILALLDTGDGDENHGRVLARYGLDGELRAAVRLSRGARQLLDVGDETAVLLLVDDSVGEVVLP